MEPGPLESSLVSDTLLPASGNWRVCALGWELRVDCMASRKCHVADLSLSTYDALVFACVPQPVLRIRNRVLLPGTTLRLTLGTSAGCYSPNPWLRHRARREAVTSVACPHLDTTC